MSTADEIEFLKRWAADQKAYFQDEGEVGFGRECVGIVKGDEYPSYEEWDISDIDAIRAIHDCPEAQPPPETPDAYHKHPCLAVLGRGPDAIHQLYVWVKRLEERGVVIEERPRTVHNAIDLAFHGTTMALLVKRAVAPPESAGEER